MESTSGPTESLEASFPGGVLDRGGSECGGGET
jgi:hypothetical protein